MCRLGRRRLLGFRGQLRPAGFGGKVRRAPWASRRASSAVRSSRGKAAAAASASGVIQGMTTAGADAGRRARRRPSAARPGCGLQLESPRSVRDQGFAAFDLLVLEGAGLGEAVGADGGAAQRGQVAADAEGGAEVAGEGADVGAARAADQRVDVEEVAVGADVGDGELVDGDRAGGQLGGGARAGELVGALAVDLDRADPRRDLGDLAGQLGDLGVDGVAVKRPAAGRPPVGCPSASSVLVDWPRRIVATYSFSVSVR